MKRSLLYALLLCFAFMLVEGIGGVFAGSLAMIGDAAHMRGRGVCAVRVDLTAEIVDFCPIRSVRPSPNHGRKRDDWTHGVPISAAHSNTILPKRQERQNTRHILKVIRSGAAPTPRTRAFEQKGATGRRKGRGLRREMVFVGMMPNLRLGETPQFKPWGNLGAG